MQVKGLKLAVREKLDQEFGIAVARIKVRSARCRPAYIKSRHIVVSEDPGDLVLPFSNLGVN